VILLTKNLIILVHLKGKYCIGDSVIDVKNNNVDC